MDSPNTDHLGLYFVNQPGAFEAPIEKLEPTKEDAEEKVARALKLMKLAAAGEHAKRKPIHVWEDADGTFHILDGNSTYQAARLLGLPSLLAMKDHRSLLLEFQSKLPKLDDKLTALKQELKSLFTVDGGDRFPHIEVSGRVKDLASLTEKLLRKKSRSLNEVKDLIGMRISMPSHSDVKAVWRILELHFPDYLKLDTYQDRYRSGAAVSEFNYNLDARHFVIEEPGLCLIEIQVRTELQTAWADLAHDTLYKSEHLDSHFKDRVGLPSLPVDPSRDSAKTKATLELIDNTFEKSFRDLSRMDMRTGLLMTEAEAKQQVAWRELALTILDASEGPLLKAKVNRLSAELARCLRLMGDLKRCLLVEGAKGGASFRSLEYERLLARLAHFVAAWKPDQTQALSLFDDLGGWIASFEDSRLQGIPKSARAGGHGRPEESDEPPTFEDIASIIDRRQLAHAIGHQVEAGILAGVAPGSLLEQLNRARLVSPDDPMLLALAIHLELLSEVDPRVVVSAHLPSIHRAIDRCTELHAMGVELPWCLFIRARLELLLDLQKKEVSRRGFETYCHALALGRQPIYGLNIEALRMAELRFLNALPGDANQVKDAKALLKLAAPWPKGSTLAIVVAGTTDSAAGTSGQDSSTPNEKMDLAKSLLSGAYAMGDSKFPGRIVYGGTSDGICGVVEQLPIPKGQLVPFPPVGMGDAIPNHADCSQDLMPVFGYWKWLQDNDVDPSGVTVLGFGGGAISRLEYRIGLALGATVGIQPTLEREGLLLLQAREWRSIQSLLMLPADPATYWVAVRRPPTLVALGWSEDELNDLAGSIHLSFVDAWKREKLLSDIASASFESLRSDIADSNRSQALWIASMLAVEGIRLARKDAVPPGQRITLSEDQISRIAELEHGRWNVDKLLNGYRLGAVRDDAKHRRHPSLLPYDATGMLKTLYLDNGSLAEEKVAHQLVDKFEGSEKQKDAQVVRSWEAILFRLGWVFVNSSRR